MLTNNGWVDGSGSNPGGGFRNPRGGRETCGGGDGLEGPVGVRDSLGDDDEVQCVLLLEMDFDRALWGERRDYFPRRCDGVFLIWFVTSNEDVGPILVDDEVFNMGRRMDFPTYLALLVEAIGFFALSVSKDVHPPYDEVGKIEFNYKFRTYGFIKSEKRLKAYSLKEWKHIVFKNERWSNYSSFIEEALFKSAVRLSQFFIYLSSTMDSR
ncbi:hypothetical protein Tco_0278668 [Tanacetum coccineum]